MAGPVHIPFLSEGMLLLGVAGIAVPLFQRLHISPVLGYLIAGFLLGPFGLVLLMPPELQNQLFMIPTHQEVQGLAELGIVFLLFMIGLDLSPASLWALRRFVLGMGSLQFLLTSFIICMAAWAFGNGLAASIIIGAALGLSSTAIVMQILADRHETASPLGRATFSILLLQDLAVVPVLVLAGAMTGDEASLSTSLFYALAKAVIAVVIILLLGRIVLRPLFRLASRAIGAEAFLAVALMVSIGTAMLTGAAGLSMALGAFLAGMLLAETEFNAQIQTYLSPFKGLLLGVFFMSVGMGFDLRSVMGNIEYLGLALVGMVLLKSSIITALATIFGIARSQAVELGLLLSQSGEFAFIILGVAMGTGLISAPVGQFLFLLTGLSMILTPPLAVLARRLSHHLDKADEEKNKLLHSEIEPPPSPPDPLDHNGHIILAGYGRVGRIVAQVLDEAKIPWIALDTDIRTVSAARQKNLPVWYGDARQPQLLEAVRAPRAQAFIVTMTSTRITEEIIRHAHQNWPLIPIHARAKDRTHARYLRGVGAIEVVPENLELALQFSAQIMRLFKVDESTITQRLSLVREASLRE